MDPLLTLSVKDVDCETPAALMCSATVSGVLSFVIVSELSPSVSQDGRSLVDRNGDGV
jgi:hypothetical protein